MNKLKEFFSSKKFIMTIIGLTLEAIVIVVPELEPYQADLSDVIWKLVVGYVIGQGMADFGKAVKK